ncbi:MAG: DUF4142 domain-containing protein [Ginsengibacter sp.]
MKKITSIILIGAVCFMQACNSSDDSVDKANEMNDKKDSGSMSSAAADTMAVTPVNDNVADFAVKAANAGMTEITLGKMAEEKATVKNVKDYGAMLVKDHTAAADELKGIAASKNITLPVAPGDDMQKHIDALSKETGKDFDKDYINQMISDHKDAVDLFKDASLNSKDSAMKDFAAKTLPVLQKHLDKAQEIAKKNNY